MTVPDERPQARVGDWMQTYSGRQYCPLDPRAEEVDDEDIAHHLGMICRYCGACRRFYSVAEQQARVDAALARQADLDERAERLKQSMRAVGHPVREDFASRAAYRSAVANFRRKGRP